MSETYRPDYHDRRSIRLRGYDYKQAGAYYITICTEARLCLFGDITDEDMILNEPGRMVFSVWNELPQHYLGVDIDAFVVMPNHIHGVVVLFDQEQASEVDARLALPDVVYRFNSLTTALYRKGVYENGWQPFPGKLWQHNYYEHIIRDEDELDGIREYIYYNPAHWADDKNNPITW